MTAGSIILYKGSHGQAECADGKRCLFEWYNWLTRRQNTDIRPPGVSRVLHTFGIRLNDYLPDAKRQQLAALLPSGGPSPLDGTDGDGLDEARALMAANWALHTGARTWLAAAGLTGELSALDAIPALTGRAALDAALPAIRDLRDRLQAGRSALYAGLRAKIRAQLAESKPPAADAAAAAAAAAVAAAVAAAAADAAAAAVAAPRSATYNQVYRTAKEAALKAIQDKHAPAIATIEYSAIALYKAMITPGPRHQRRPGAPGDDDLPGSALRAAADYIGDAAAGLGAPPGKAATP